MNTLNTGQNHSEVIRLRRKNSVTAAAAAYVCCRRRRYNLMTYRGKATLLIGDSSQIRVKFSDIERHLSYQK